MGCHGIREDSLLIICICSSNYVDLTKDFYFKLKTTAVPDQAADEKCFVDEGAAAPSPTSSSKSYHCFDRETG